MNHEHALGSAPAAAPRTARAHDGVQLALQLHGDGGPTVTTVNSFFLTASMWRPLVEQLTAGNRVVTYDMRNQGQSTTVASVAWADHVADLGRVLDDLNVARTYLVATSVSSLICRDLCLAQPDRVTGLILLGPVLSPYGGARRRAVSRIWLAVLEHMGTTALWDHLWAMCVGPTVIERGGAAMYLALRESFTSQFDAVSLQANLACAQEADDDPALLQLIDCPTLIIAGDDDFMLGPSTVAALHELIPRSRLHVLPRVGHLPYWEATGAVAEATEAFIQECEAPRPVATPGPTTTAPPGDTNEKVATLTRILGESVELDRRFADPAEAARVSLPSLLLDSLTFLAFISRVEETFGIRWPEDEPPSTFASLAAVAARLDGAGAPVGHLSGGRNAHRD